MAFKIFPLGPGVAERIEMVGRTMRRMHAMTDPFLARNLLRLARQARQEMPDVLGNPGSTGYDPALVWQVIPELAKRIGGAPLLPNEGCDFLYTAQDARGLRETVGRCLDNSSLGRLAVKRRASAPTAPQEPLALDILGHDFVNGNPIAMAADRLHPPAPEGSDREDWLARHMREISRYRFGHAGHAAWSPSFQDYRMEADVRSIFVEETGKMHEEILEEVVLEADCPEGP